MTNPNNNLFKPTELKTISKLGKLIGAASVLFFGWIIIIAPEPNPALSSLPHTLSPEIVKYANELGINKDHLVDAGAIFGDASQACGQGEAQGCYDGKITITPNQTPEQTKKALAHEYMHYVWAKKETGVAKVRIGALASSFYNDHKSVVEPRFKAYSHVHGASLENEYQAIFCTEISDYRLTTELLEHCTKWLPNRNALPSYF